MADCHWCGRYFVNGYGIAFGVHVDETCLKNPRNKNLKVECSLCGQQFSAHDKDLKKRKERHVQGRHTHHSVFGQRPYQQKLISKSGMGGLIIGYVHWNRVRED